MFLFQDAPFSDIFDLSFCQRREIGYDVTTFHRSRQLSASPRGFLFDI